MAILLTHDIFVCLDPFVGLHAAIDTMDSVDEVDTSTMYNIHTHTCWNREENDCVLSFPPLPFQLFLLIRCVFSAFRFLQFTLCLLFAIVNTMLKFIVPIFLHFENSRRNRFFVRFDTAKLKWKMYRAKKRNKTYPMIMYSRHSVAIMCYCRWCFPF